MSEILTPPTQGIRTSEYGIGAEAQCENDRLLFTGLLVHSSMCDIICDLARGPSCKRKQATAGLDQLSKKGRLLCYHQPQGGRLLVNHTLTMTWHLLSLSLKVLKS